MNRKFWFGKYKGRAILDIINEDYQYIDWCLKNVPTFTLNKTELKLYESKKTAHRINIKHLGGMCSEIDFTDFDDYTFGMINCADDM